MADPRTLARRYARALLMSAPAGEIEKLGEDLKGLAEAWRTSSDLRALMQHPSVPRAQKRAAFHAILASASPLLARFVDLLLEKKRLVLIEDIAQEFAEAADEAQGIARARVSSFLPLDAGQREKLLSKLGKFTDRRVIEIEETVDARLLGGIVVRIGDQVLDGSIEGRLRKLRERLLLREDERAQQAAANAVEALRG